MTDLNTATQATNEANVEQATEKARAAYLVQRDNRKRFSFGNAWLNAVLAGVVSDKDKLVAHAIKLKAGSASDLRKLRMETLIAKVQAKILASDTPAAE